MTYRHTILPDGTQMWTLDNKFHRGGDLPAVIYPDGTQYWYRKGKIHRNGDLPAVVHSDGSKAKAISRQPFIKAAYKNGLRKGNVTAKKVLL